jgi:predicted NAD/FAD-binding protein
MQIAIIGTGIAGMGCAHRLHKMHDITVYEQDNYIAWTYEYGLCK